MRIALLLLVQELQQFTVFGSAAQVPNTDKTVCNLHLKYPADLYLNCLGEDSWLPMVLERALRSLWVLHPFCFY